MPGAASATSSAALGHPRETPCEREALASSTPRNQAGVLGGDRDESIPPIPLCQYPTCGCRSYVGCEVVGNHIDLPQTARRDDGSARRVAHRSSDERASIAHVPTLTDLGGGASRKTFGPALPLHEAAREMYAANGLRLPHSPLPNAPQEDPMNDSKLWYQSKTIWASLLIVLASILQAVGYTLSSTDQDAVSGIIPELITGVMGLVAIWGRVRASKRVTLTTPASAFYYASESDYGDGEPTRSVPSSDAGTGSGGTGGRESSRTSGTLLVLVSLLAVAAMGTGCESINADYVAADRATYDAISPVTRGLLDGSIKPEEVDADEREMTTNTLDAWELRLKTAESP